MVTYPKAEMVARKMSLPMMVDPIIKELYGYAVPMLDVKQAHRVLSANGILTITEREVAMEILEQRITLL